jgi:hypothetical protein
MQYKIRYKRWQFLLMVFVAGMAVASISKISSAGNANGAAQQPEVLRLETRVAQLEQRLYMMETSLRNLDQQSRVANSGARGVNTTDSAALRAELYVLQQLLVEHECALTKLDERTLAPEIRTARKRTGAVNNACRTNFDSPLQLPIDRRN